MRHTSPYSRNADAANAEPPNLSHNVAALGTLHLANIVFPLITLPYLTRVLGAEAYGQVVFVQVLVGYLVLITDYGFSWSTTRKIAAHRYDRALVGRIFVNAWAAQWCLVFLSLGLAAFAIAATDRLRTDAALYAMGLMSVVGNALFPIWYLQGIERIRDAASIQIGARAIALVPIFTVVHEPEDAILVIAITGGAAILAGISALWRISRARLIDWRWPEIRLVLQELREAGTLFASRIAASLYTALVPLILGWIAGPVALGHFALADKLRNAAQVPLIPLSQALFPRISYLMVHSPQVAYGLLRKGTLIVIGLAGSSSIVLWIIADWIVLTIGGPDFSAAAEILRWIALLPLVTGLSNVFGLQTMIPNQLTHQFNAIIFAAAILSLAIGLPIIYEKQAIGAAQTMLATEMLVTLSMGAFLWHRGILSRIYKGAL